MSLFKLNPDFKERGRKRVSLEKKMSKGKRVNEERDRGEERRRENEIERVISRKILCE